MFSQYPRQHVGSHPWSLGDLSKRGQAQIRQVRHKLWRLIVSSLHDYHLRGAFGCEKLCSQRDGE